jgi:hypothetical protein
MTRRLLDRQVRLLEHLTSSDAIFPDKRSAPLDHALQGIDRRMLDIEARFSHEKRMEKIAAVFPKTRALLGASYDAIVREFVETCPPQDISRIANARQFHDLLSARWSRRPPVPLYLPDVAACELACATIRVAADGGPAEAMPADAGRPAIRRTPGVVLLRTAFDVRSIFEGGSNSLPLERQTLLAIAFNSGEPQIYELTPEVFDVLAALDRWVAVEEIPNADGLFADLAEAGMLELRR